jgi:hypothetical protein
MRFANLSRRIIIGSMRQLPKFLWLALMWLVVSPTAGVACSPLVRDAEPASASPCMIAGGDDVSTVACTEQASSLPTLKQNAGKTLLKAAATGPRPVRLSRIRAQAATSGCGAFLPADTLQIQAVRLQN